MGRMLKLTGDQAKFWASLLLFAVLGPIWSVVAIPAHWSV